MAEMVSRRSGVWVEWDSLSRSEVRAAFRLVRWPVWVFVVESPSAVWELDLDLDLDEVDVLEEREGECRR